MELPTDKLQVLVVEDSNTAIADIRLKLAKLIPAKNIHIAKSYDEAVPMLMHHDFDMAFVDLQMPHKTGMDLIIDVIQKNTKTKALPVVVTTGIEPDSLITFTLKPYTYRYLFKPIQQEELEEAIASILNSEE
jgi:CheY-like chemotaxis protein